MWVFGKYGFTSAVAYDPTKDREKTSPFRDIAKQPGTHILLRARIEADLEDVRDRVLPTMVIDEQPSADYSYRAVLPRSVFKKYLALMVDEIDYDSHFKEVAEKHGKGVSGSSRHSAYMKVWSALASLQKHSPYGGGGFGYGGGYSSGTDWYGGGGTSKGSGSTTSKSGSGKKSAPFAGVGSGSLRPGSADMESFLDDFVSSEGTISYRAGGGPRMGYKPGDRVEGYFGFGTVESIVKHGAVGKAADTVLVKPDDTKKKPATFMSNFLIPEGIAAKYGFDADADAEADVIDGTSILDKDPTNGVQVTLEQAWDFLFDINCELSKIATSDYQDFNDDAFEFITRLMERHGKDATLSTQQVSEVYDEICWEIGSDAYKVAWVNSDREIPAKYENEAVKVALKAQDEADSQTSATV